MPRKTGGSTWTLHIFSVSLGADFVANSKEIQYPEIHWVAPYTNSEYIWVNYHQSTFLQCNMYQYFTVRWNKPLCFCISILQWHFNHNNEGADLSIQNCTIIWTLEMFASWFAPPLSTLVDHRVWIPQQCPLRYGVMREQTVLTAQVESTKTSNQYTTFHSTELQTEICMFRQRFFIFIP